MNTTSASINTPKKVEPGEIQGIEPRSSAAEFLSFTTSSGEQGIEVLFQNEMIWATQRTIAELFDCTVQNVGQHLKDLYECEELDAKATIKDFFTVQTEGKRLFASLKKLANAEDKEPALSWGYIVPTSALRYCRYLKIFGFVQSQQFQKNNLHIPEIRKDAIETAIATEDFLYAEKLCLEGIAQNAKTVSWKTNRITNSLLGYISFPTTELIRQNLFIQRGCYVLILRTKITTKH